MTQFGQPSFHSPRFLRRWGFIIGDDVVRHLLAFHHKALQASKQTNSSRAAPIALCCELPALQKLRF
jgi:hypothetical protein